MSESGESDRESGVRRGPLWWGRRRSVVLDVWLALVSATECAVQGGRFSGQVGLPHGVGVVVGLLVGGLLVVRRRWPIPVVLVSVAVMPVGMGVLLGFVGLYSLAASDVPRRITAVLTAMQGVGALIITYVRLHGEAGPTFHPPVWFLALVAVVLAVGVTAPPVLLGLYVRARRRLVESLRERADGLERELALLAERAEERAEWARGEERTRIAREMHDVVAHRVSLMVVHAAALQAVVGRDAEKAARNAALVGDMGRQALAELRTMLGVLRGRDAEGVARGAGEPGSGERGAGEPGVGVPLAGVAAAVARVGGSGGRAAAAVAVVEGEGPSLDGLEELVGQSRAAGMPVELSVDGVSAGYAPVVEQTAFRVVQEALTNVHKHASGARTRVRLAHRGEEVAVQVENEPPVDAGGVVAALPSGGNGLVGMRERVSALGGGFVSGPTDAGGFRVSAVIPAGGAGRGAG